MSSEENVSWHNTKGLSISIILLLLINVVSTVWWAATLTSDVQEVSEEARLISFNRERIIRIEAKQELYDSVLSRLNNTIDKVITTVDRIDREQATRGPRLKALERKK